MLSNIGVLRKGVFIDLRARNFMHAITYLRARCAHARHRARSSASPDSLVYVFRFLRTI